MGTNNKDWDTIWDIDPASEYPTIPTHDEVEIT